MLRLVIAAALAPDIGSKVELIKKRNLSTSRAIPMECKRTQYFPVLCENRNVLALAKDVILNQEKEHFKFLILRPARSAAEAYSKRANCLVAP